MAGHRSVIHQLLKIVPGPECVRQANAVMDGAAVAELAQQFYVHAHQSTQWKTHLPKRAGVVPEGNGQQERPAIDVKALRAKIGAANFIASLRRGEWKTLAESRRRR